MAKTVGSRVLHVFGAFYQRYADTDRFPSPPNTPLGYLDVRLQELQDQPLREWRDKAIVWLMAGELSEKIMVGTVDIEEDLDTLNTWLKHFPDTFFVHSLPTEWREALEPHLELTFFPSEE